MHLNPEQKKAAEQIEGRVLVLAGAGSGKTRVIIQRMLYMIQIKNIAPTAILGLTFTNKAAKEMQERLKKELGKPADQVFLSTFHSFCVSVLRADICRLGYTKKFSLYDEKDIQRLVKNIVKELALETTLSTQEILQEMQESRTKGKNPSSPEVKQVVDRLFLALRAYNALDFDHLLEMTCQLFEMHPAVLEKYQDRFRYISIDEYQDTNPVQFRLAELLAKKHRNLFVVGDDDQSIYGFRGADMQNILRFSYDRLIKLEQNYRSIPHILDAANQLIDKNQDRHKKTLWCDKKDTSKISIFHAPSEEKEAEAIVERLLRLITQRGYAFKDIGILYRSNILARTIEKALLSARYWKKGALHQGIPYEVFGGLSFSERAEIKDLSAYLKALVNPNDQESLLRIINVPRKGISAPTLDTLTKKARQTGVSLYSLFTHIDQEEISSRGKNGIKSFVSLFEETKQRLQNKPYFPTLSWFLEEIDYKRAIEEEVKSEKMQRFKWENVEAFLASLEAFEQDHPDQGLEDFISASSLTKTPLHRKQDEDTVKLMTFHSAKGLEFTACFLLGLEDHILPHEKSQEEKNYEEERRLFYVGITRAKQYLCLSMAKERAKMGKKVRCNPSRFLFELPKNSLSIESHQL